MSAKNISGKVVIVTGGTTGIGLAACVQFAQAGCKVAFTGRNGERGKQALDTIRKETGCAADAVLFIQGDVASEEMIKGMYEKVVATFKKVDFVVNNAASLGPFVLFEDMDSETFDQIMKVNVYGTFNSMKYAIKQMKAQGKPAEGNYAIVNVASVVGLEGFSYSSTYAGTKSAIIGFTKSVAREVAKEGININSVCPGSIDTPMVSMLDDAAKSKLFERQVIGRQGKPEEIADAIVFACTSPFLMGHQLAVDGGWTGY